MTTAVVTVSLVPLAGSFTADEARPLIQKEYFPEVERAIQEAETSIYLIMYGIQPPGRTNDPVEKLLDELIEAKRRGVEVNVILETSGEEEWGEYVTDVNKETKKLLERKGIRVSLDDPREVTHCKVLVIDEYIVIVGSHNWTYSAMLRNNESSILVKSRDVARKYISYFYSIRR